MPYVAYPNVYCRPDLISFEIINKMLHDLRTLATDGGFGSVSSVLIAVGSSPPLQLPSPAPTRS